MLGQQHRRRHILQHVGQAVCWIGRVQRHIGAAGFQHGQQAYHHLQRTLHAQAHQHIRAHAQRAQVMRQAVGPRIELAVGQRYVVILQRHPIRRGRRALLEQRMDGPSRHTGSRRLVPLHQQLMAFGVIQHVQVLDAALRVGHDRLQQAREVPSHARHRRWLEQVGVVADAAVKASGLLRERERQVELGLCALIAHGLQGQAGQRECIHRRVLQCQHHLEQRRMAGVALRLEHLDQLLERHVLVRVSIQRVAAYMVEQLQEAGAVIDLRAQHQGVDEEADQPFRLRAVAVGDRRADADVVLSSVTRQQHVEGRRQRHEQRAVLLAAQRIEGRRGGGRQCERLRRAAMGLMYGARVVRRQRQ
ncbi:hypothetical protein DUGA6_30120 [Duganella sp. HH105]|nr:hypothetical protein DUGA6_30120 [Duganella sp. HH105]